jgi:hypothetical protein
MLSQILNSLIQILYVITKILANTSERWQKNEEKKYNVWHDISAKLKQNRILVLQCSVLKIKEK